MLSVSIFTSVKSGTAIIWTQLVISLIPHIPILQQCYFVRSLIFHFQEALISFLTKYVTYHCPSLFQHYWKFASLFSCFILFDIYLMCRQQFDGLIIQGEYKIFPWLQTFINGKLLYVEYNSRRFFTTHQFTSTCALFVERRTSNR